MTMMGSLPPLDIFILAGQSNMAGRGPLHDLPPPSPHHLDSTKSSNSSTTTRTSHNSGTPPRPVLAFHGDNVWAPAKEPLHATIDLKKADRCGVGPGLAFATNLLQMDPTIQGIGLVPSAIGGASLEEWSPHYDPSHPTRHGGNNTHPTYLSQQKCPNLYTTTIQRVRQCLASAPSQSRVRGLLWYQGETDAMYETATTTYTTRFQDLLQSFRSDLGLPDLPVVVIAITSTTAKLAYLRDMRQILLGLPKALPPSPSVMVIDTFGLGLNPDGLHLATWSQLELGRRLAMGMVGHKAHHGPCSSVMDYLPDLLAGIPDEFKADEEKMQTWAWALDECKTAYKLVVRVEKEYEMQQELIHEGVSKVQRDIDNLLRNLRERDQVLSRLCSPDAPPLHTTSSTSASTSTSLRISSQHEEVLVQDEPETNPLPLQEREGQGLAPSTTTLAATSSSDSLPEPNSRTLVDTNLIERARMLARNVNIYLGGEGEQKGRDALRCSSTPVERTLPPLESLPLPPPSQTWDTSKDDDNDNTGHYPSLLSSLGDRSSNFIYGEINVLSLLALLTHHPGVGGRPGGGHEGVFYDLGCGEGKTLLAALASGRFSRVVGLELIASLSEKAQGMLEIMQGVVNPSSNGGEMEQQGQEAVVLQEDLFSYDWSDGDVAYMCGTCFDGHQMARLAHKARGLKPGSRLILIDKTLKEAEEADFALVLRCQCHVTWGSAIANVYRRGTTD